MHIPSFALLQRAIKRRVQANKQTSKLSPPSLKRNQQSVKDEEDRRGEDVKERKKIDKLIDCNTSGTKIAMKENDNHHQQKFGAQNLKQREKLLMKLEQLVQTLTLL